MNQRKLLFEVWEEIEEAGRCSALLLAGPRGEKSRKLLGSHARLVTTNEAGSHFEAMTIYYRLMSWGEFTTDQSSDYDHFPEEWIVEQQKAGDALNTRDRKPEL
jgi:hypothetical protein